MPGLLMLASDRTAWGDFPMKIHEAGYTVLAVNVRQDAPASDFTVMIQSLNTGEADPARLAVMGADTGADAALKGCAGDLLCDAVVLLSPSARLRVAYHVRGDAPLAGAWLRYRVYKENEEIRFDLLVGAVGRRTRIAMGIVAALALLILYGLSFKASFDYVAFMKVERTAYLGIRFDWLFCVYVIFAVAAIARYLWLGWRALRGKAPEAPDPTRASSGV